VRTWFDMDRLEGGDDYDRKIQKNIARCSYFHPGDLREHRAADGAYFRREWSYAIDRTRNMADDAIFILPICVDETNVGAARVPDKFRSLHITPAAGGDAPGGVREAACASSSRPTHERRRRSRPARRGGTSATLNLVDPEHPWLGLDSFSEETRQYFYGRDEEVAELARRVQRKTLSILFGQSGLGQDLHPARGHRAAAAQGGLLPGLRAHRLRARIAGAVAADQAGDLPRDRGCRDAGRGRARRSRASRCGNSSITATTSFATRTATALRPLIIFDQFEEIFTLGQGDAFGRERANEFIDDLADLVENRPPKALELMIESEDAIVDRFDFERADYRILIALREDYLAHLEGLKGRMPSITQNRMRPRRA
jgi:hypothetical protein